MSEKKIIRTRIAQKSNFVIEDCKPFKTFGRIQKITDSAIQISNGGTGCKIWVDTAYFKDQTNDAVDSLVAEGDDVEIQMAIGSFIKKTREFAVKFHLLTIKKVERDDKGEWADELLRPVFEASFKLNDVVKTDMSTLVVLKGQRVDEFWEEREDMIFRFYNQYNSELKKGTYRIKFSINSSSRIILENGEIYKDEEVFTQVIDGQEVEKRSPVFIPTLDIKEMLLEIE